MARGPRFDFLLPAVDVPCPLPRCCERSCAEADVTVRKIAMIAAIAERAKLRYT